MQKIWRIEERDVKGDLISASSYFASKKEAQQRAEEMFEKYNYYIASNWLKL